MKEPIEYLGNVNSFTTREELYRIGKQIQNDAQLSTYKDLLEDCKGIHPEYVEDLIKNYISILEDGI